MEYFQWTTEKSSFFANSTFFTCSIFTKTQIYHRLIDTIKKLLIANIPLQIQNTRSRYSDKKLRMKT
jgi:hypothetical protein